MSEQKNKSTVSKPTVAAVNRISTSNTMRIAHFIAQNYLVIWVDGNIDENNEDCRNTLKQLRVVVSEVNICMTQEQCVEFLNEIDDGKIFIISSGALGQHLVSCIHSMTQVHAIYIFCGNEARHQSWAKEWSKIRGVFTSIKPICESLRKVARECDHDTIPMSFVSKQTIAEGAADSNKTTRDQLPPSYMYSVIFKDIILEIEDDVAKSINTLLVFCRQKDIPESELDHFQRVYKQKSPIWWYTNEMFLYGMLNCALRSLDMEAMTKLGFFIRSLHLQLEQLHQEQSANFQKSFTVYRGQGFSQRDFQNLIDSKGGLLSFNNFLSTSKKRDVATVFIQETLRKNQDTVGVMFIMTIDRRKIANSINPFAMIDDYSALPQEQEILFTMHTVFRVVDIKQAAKNSRLWEVQLSITDESDPQLSALTNRIKEEIHGEGWYRMGQLMLKMGHLDQAEELYSKLLENSSSGNETAYIYHQLGWIKDDQGKYEEAAKFYRKSLRINEKLLSADDPKLSAMYSNIGQVYCNMGDYSLALEFYEKSHRIFEKALPSNHPNLATSYNNIAGVYYNMNDYSKALKFYEKSLKIREKALLPTHPHLASSYSNIGLLYEKMGEYSKAFFYLEKALTIFRKSLPSTHPHIITAMNSIDRVNKKR
ncbi:unnamed protein product [Rotaria socialis]|uniref:NAD(P)(+)--arginine ADP-ribosyltransferase n=1 Tax=Rotaria socialis TaxID=392032 RepID=A0A817WSU5_9BILA|nr:unnamed protein product [Rotaria socialis]CAF3387489.1 unnamed protein product [Rotaria socialis]CAF3648885.1 unnamed protein product [Rotaria socialis]CAF4214989.1 unnamed protein product [Rotaria socialis]CAF4560980.1 unnamed protein product [Rotaria socialis]